MDLQRYITTPLGGEYRTPLAFKHLLDLDAAFQAMLFEL